VPDMKTERNQGIVLLRITLLNGKGVTMGTSDCSTRSESHNNIGCTANKSVPLLQQRCTTMIGRVGFLLENTNAQGDGM